MTRAWMKVVAVGTSRSGAKECWHGNDLESKNVRKETMDGEYLYFYGLRNGSLENDAYK